MAMSPEECAHRAFLLELAQALRLPPGSPFQIEALKTPLTEEAEEFISSGGTEDDWCQLQRNCLERVREVVSNMDALARKSV